MSERDEQATPVDRGQRAELRADCARCFGLCCVAPAFSASADFAITKEAGKACPHLEADYRCGIHAQLRQRGFPGCCVYDCFGAGQKVSTGTFGGQDWRRVAHVREQMFEVFVMMRQLHELLWYLAEALTLPPARPIHAQLRAAFDGTERLTRGSPESLVELDVAGRRRDISTLLHRASGLVRAEARRGKRDRGGADLIGADLRGADLRGVDLSGAYLIGADLRRANLRVADLLGADVRGANLAGADLAGAIFLSQSQLTAAKGDAETKIPPSLTRPTHWSPSTAPPPQASPAGRDRA